MQMEGMEMNDYAFGNYLYGLRREAGLTQAELARAMGVTNKAVSKWETGKAKPSTNIIRTLADFYGISVENLLELRNREDKTMSISKIVITGGPCAGKTTAMSWIQSNLARLGYRVLFVPETATELITGGGAPWTCVAEKSLIVCDRAALDNRAYMTDGEFATVLADLGCSEVELRDGYDAVFHLVTAAKGAEQFYTTANNTARTETVEQAAALDDKLISAWTGHPHLRVIDNSSDFEDKLKRLIQEITSFLGEPEPLENERKFLIAYPDVKALEKMPNCQRVEIIQTYITAPEGEESRVRQRGADGHYVYFQTTKRRITGQKRVEVERRLSQEEYLRLLMDADPNCRPIRKTRYCLTYDNQYFEIDVYPFWQDQAILEIELSGDDPPVRFPDFLRIIREVTQDDSYKNAALARI